VIGFNCASAKREGQGPAGLAVFPDYCYHFGHGHWGRWERHWARQTFASFVVFRIGGGHGLRLRKRIAPATNARFRPKEGLVGMPSPGRSSAYGSGVRRHRLQPATSRSSPIVSGGSVDTLAKPRALVARRKLSV
jgi:hypothetical protein